MPAPRITLAILTALSAVCAQAGDWEVSNQLQVDSYVTDNVRQSANGSTGLVVSVRPQIGIRGEGGRVSGEASYAPSLTMTVGDSADSVDLAHTLDADFLSELQRDQLFVEATATARLVNTSSLATGGRNATTDSGNSFQSYGTSVSPYHILRFGSTASLTTRLDADAVWSDSSDSGVDSTGLGANIILASGTDFGRMSWSLSGNHNIVSYDDREDTTSNVIGQVGYRFTSRWRGDVQLGYQRAELATLRGTSSGSTYSAGLYWTPNPRFAAEARYGRQFYGNFWNAEIRHDLRKVSWSLNTRRELTNTRAQILRGVTLGERASSLNIALPPGIDPTLVVDAVAGSVDEEYLSTTFGGNLAIVGVRTQLGIDFAIDNREYQLTQRSEDNRSIGVTLSRQLRSGLTGSADIYRNEVKSDLSGNSVYWQYGLGLSRAIGRQTSLAMRVSRVERTGAGTGDYTEHRIGLVLTTKMF